jgi:hypothetical protein
MVEETKAQPTAGWRQRWRGDGGTSERRSLRGQWRHWGRTESEMERRNKKKVGMAVGA